MPFVREVSDLLLGTPDSCYFHHSTYLWCDLSLCFDMGRPTLNFLSLYFSLSLVHYFSYFYSILFSSFLFFFPTLSLFRLGIFMFFLHISLVFDIFFLLLSSLFL